MHITFLENKPNVAGKGPTWLFDLDYLTDSMNYQPVRSENQANKHACPKEANHSGLLSLQTSQELRAKNEVELSEREVCQAMRICIFKQELPKAAVSKHSVNIASSQLVTAYVRVVYDQFFWMFFFTMPSLDNEGAHSSQQEQRGQQVLEPHAFGKNSEFKIQKVWILVDLPYGKKAIGTKWVYRNKKDERGVVVRNKARIFLAYASYMGFIVYQMDVKSVFLYGKIDEKVYVSQPPVFVDPKYPKKVYKVVKALYGLHQAPRACSTKRSWCDEFEALMKSRFQMSSMGELTFFLGLQVKQKEDGIFISHDKYVVEILKKFNFASVKTTSTPIETQKPLVKDEEASDVDYVLVLSFQVLQIPPYLNDVRDLIGSKLDRKSKQEFVHIWQEIHFMAMQEQTIVVPVLGCFRESLERDINGTEELLLPDLFILWLTKVSTDRPDEGTDKPKVSTDKPEVSTDRPDDGTDKPKSGYRRGTIDKTLVIKKDKNDIISMGELIFFLGLQVKQKEDGIFISQDKYVVEILKKFDFASIKTASTPIETQKPLVKDEEASVVDVYLYRSMIGSLMYLTASRPDIMFAVCACSRFQVTPKTSYLNVCSLMGIQSFIKLSAFLREASFTMLSLYITSKVAGKPMSISEASIRSDLLFDDADGIDSLPN
ncbi:retrovirus-related pol polyprotein from transposon TNT 1-94 [Tanacetum coccineum]